MAKRHRREDIEELLRRRERQGLTNRELSEISGVPVPTLAWWSRRLEREAADPLSTGELVAVEVVEDEVDESDVAIEVVVGDRLRLIVPATASEVLLRQILRAALAC